MLGVWRHIARTCVMIQQKLPNMPLYTLLEYYNKHNYVGIAVQL